MPPLENTILEVSIYGGFGIRDLLNNASEPSIDDIGSLLSFHACHNYASRNDGVSSTLYQRNRIKQTSSSSIS